MADNDRQTNPSPRRSKVKERGSSMAVVGVGVSAASLRSLEQLFATLRPDIGAAYIIAVRQQEGLDVATVVEALRRQSPLPVKIAADGERLEPTHIYVGGPEDIVTIVDGHVEARPATESVGHRGTIDSMLISLCEHVHDRAIAVLLTGLGSDGTAGVTATKQYGGLSIAELADGEDANSAGIGAVGPRAVVDLHLPIAEIAAQIALYADSLVPVADDQIADAVAHGIEGHLTQITTLLRNVTSHDFHGYKRGTFVRRVQRRMQVMQIEGIDAYVARLQSDRDEVENLFRDLLIGVTQFFRDPAEFEALEREIPRLFAGKNAGNPVRVWVLGCATGEEAYSLAILLREHMATLDHPPEAQIFATDLDSRALGLARAGRYAAEAITGHVRPDRLDRWFTREGATYCVAKELREMCIFSPHNIVKDAPFSRIDILSCRNLLIYLNGDLQNRVIPIFHFSLRPGGILFLGSSENVTRHQKLFAPVDRRNRVFRRLETATRVIPDFPLTPRPPKHGTLDTARERPGPPARLSLPVSRQAAAVAERYAPAYVVVDLQGDVLHFAGRTGRYLEPTTGTASLALTALVHRDLRFDLRAAMQRALVEARRVELPRLLVKQDDRTHGVNLIVEPVDASGEVTSLVVVFQDAGPVADDASESGDRVASDEQFQRLEAELRMTRDRLQATIEELESSNEELKSSNEEYQSINEELQSASEEMETSKEELQSVNEELHSVNSELAHRVTELAASNSDIKNLLESTQIATVFLHNDLRVRNFTPAATEVFHLLETDVGRPLDHVVSRVAYPELADDARRVLRTLVPVERAVTDPATGRHFAARVLPYRSVDNYIGGTVVTFSDMTAVHDAQTALREREADLARVQQIGKVGGVNIDVAGGVSGGRSPEYLQLHGLPPDILRETHADWRARVFPDDLDHAEAALFAALAGDAATYDSEYRIIRPDNGALQWIHARADIERGPDGKAIRLVGAHVDITDRKLIEQALRASDERQAFLLQLSDALRPLGDPEAIKLTAATVLGRYLGANRVAYAEDHGEHFVVARNYVAGAAEVAGRRRYGDFGPDIRAGLAGGRNHVQSDVASDDSLNDDQKRSLAAADVGASLNVPLVKGGALVAFLGVNFAVAHAFAADEITLVEDVAERTWAAVARARAEAAARASEELLRQFGEASQDVLWIRDAATFQWEYLTPAFETIYGLDRAAALSGDNMAGWAELIVPEDRDRAIDDIRRVRDGEWVTFEYRIRRPSDGTIRWLRDTDFPIKDETGYVAHIGGIGHDVTELKATEAALAEAQLRQEALIEGMPQLVWRAIDGGHWTWASSQWTAYTGQAGTASHDWGWLEVVHPDDRKLAREAWATAIERGGIAVEYRVRHAPSGSNRWFQSRATPVRSADGVIVEWLGTSTDIEELRALQERQRILVDELQHRTFNLMGMVRSMADATVRSSVGLDDFKKRFRDRIDGLARVQRLLSRLKEGDRVLFDELIRSELSATGALTDDGGRITLDGPTDVALRSGTVQTVALAIHELITNAVKYGALKQPAGHLHVQWRLEPDTATGGSWLCIDWAETGVDMSAAQAGSHGTGQGRALIEEALPYQLQARTTYVLAPDGVKCSIALPVPADGADGRDHYDG